MRSFLLFIVTAFFATGCLPKGAFAPPTETYMRWSRSGANEVTLWKDMLECNYASPFDGIRDLDDAGRTFDETVATMICMERIGYAYSERGRKMQVCERYKDSASCLPDAAIPLPDAGRRLSGGYCKKYPQSRACIP